MSLSDFVFLANVNGREIETLAEGGVQNNDDTFAETQPAQNAPNAGVPSEGGFFSSFGFMAIYIVAIIAAFYFFALRPQKKREKELSNIQNSIKVGDWVMTSSGFYGKVVDIADQVFVVEFGTNKGVRIPVRRSEIIGNKEPDLTSNHTAEIESK